MERIENIIIKCEKNTCLTIVTAKQTHQLTNLVNKLYHKEGIK